MCNVSNCPCHLYAGCVRRAVHRAARLAEASEYDPRDESDPIDRAAARAAGMTDNREDVQAAIDAGEHVTAIGGVEFV